MLSYPFNHRLDTRTASVVRVLLLAVLLLPLVSAPGIISPLVVPKAIYARVLIEVALAAWLILLLVSPAHRPRPSWILAALFAWLGVAALSTVFSINPTNSLWSEYTQMGGVVNMAHWCLFGLMTASMFRTREDWTRILTISAAVSGVAAFVGLIVPIAFHEDDRLVATLGNGLFAGGYFCVSAGLVVARLLLRPSRGLAVLLYAALCLDLVALWFSASRMGLVAILIFAVVLALGCLLWGEQRRIRWAAGGILAAVLVCAVVLVAFSTVASIPETDSTVGVRRLVNTNLSDIGVMGRPTTMRASIQAVGDRPLLGYGPENFVDAWGRYAPGDWNTDKLHRDSHGTFTEALATTGILGLAAYATLWLLMLWVAARDALRARGEDRLFPVAMGAALLSYGVLCTIMPDHPAFWLQLAVFAGYLAHRESVHRPMSTAPAIRTPVVVATAAGVLAIGLVLVLWQVNLDLWRSAQLTETGSRLSYIVEEFDRMDAFPAMADGRRVRLLTAMRDGALNADADSIPNSPNWLGVIDVEVTAVLERHPTGWEWHSIVVRLYHGLSSRYPHYLEAAMPVLETLERLIPGSPYLQGLQDRQVALEAKR